MPIQPCLLQRFGFLIYCLIKFHIGLLMMDPFRSLVGLCRSFWHRRTRVRLFDRIGLQQHMCPSKSLVHPSACDFYVSMDVTLTFGTLVTQTDPSINLVNGHQACMYGSPSQCDCNTVSTDPALVDGWVNDSHVHRLSVNVVEREGKGEEGRGSEELLTFGDMTNSFVPARACRCNVFKEMQCDNCVYNYVQITCPF